MLTIEPVRRDTNGLGSSRTESKRLIKSPTCHSVLVVQMKNCEPLLFGPELAIERVPAEKGANESI